MTERSTRVLRAGTLSLLTGIGLAGLTACAASEASTTEDAAEKVSALAQDVHQTILSVRARNPALTGAPAIEAGIGNTKIYAGRGTIGPNKETVWVLPVAARVINGGGLSYTDVTLGGCLRVTATVGRTAGKVGERGRVTSEPVPCPADMTLEADGHVAKEIGVVIDALRDDVPEAPYERRPCISGAPQGCVGG